MMHDRRIATLGVAVATALMAAVAVGSAASAAAHHAAARIVSPAGDQVGWARFTEDATGTLHVNVHVSGLAEGLHGIHLHAIGACVLGTSPAFSSAGGHFNPLGHDHGLASPTGAHAGDLPNLVVNEAGIGHLDVTTDLATLTDGPTTLFDANGSAVIVHALPDDQVTNPTGNSGARVACGVIEGG